MKFTKCVLTSWTWQPLLCWCHALTRPKIPKGDQPVFPTERAPQFQFSVYCELAYFSSYLLSFWNQYSPCFTKLAKKIESQIYSAVKYKTENNFPRKFCIKISFFLRGVKSTSIAVTKTPVLPTLIVYYLGSPASIDQIYSHWELTKTKADNIRLLPNNLVHKIGI